MALVIFPDSNLRTAKLRPVLVVQADGLRTGLSQVVVAMITSNLSRDGHASRVKIPCAAAEGRRSGLLTDSGVGPVDLVEFAYDREAEEEACEAEAGPTDRF